VGAAGPGPEDPVPGGDAGKLWPSGVSGSFRQVPSQKSRDAARQQEQQIPSFSHPGIELSKVAYL